jgi:DNA helicase IV
MPKMTKSVRNAARQASDPMCRPPRQQQREQANIRERLRTQAMNDAFDNLRDLIPLLPSEKINKYQILCLAHNYIEFLTSVSSLSLSRPIFDADSPKTRLTNFNSFFSN